MQWIFKTPELDQTNAEPSYVVASNFEAERLSSYLNIPSCNQKSKMNGPRLYSFTSLVRAEQNCLQPMEISLRNVPASLHLLAGSIYPRKVIFSPS